MFTTDFILNILRDIAIAFVVGSCWGILFGTPKRILVIAGLLGGLGHCIRFVFLQMDMGLITATLAGSVFIGLVGIFVAHKVDNPPVVFTMPACITMIPGMYAYKTMLAGMKMTDAETLHSDPTLLPTMAYNLMLTISLLFTLAIGICVAALLFRATSVKEIEFAKKLERMTNFK